MISFDHQHCQDAHQYALDVVTGEIPNCRDVIAACQRYLNDLERDGFRYVYDADLADRACRFVELMPHTKGKWAGKPIILEPWQKFAICNVFGWVDAETGLRRFRRVVILVPRKNGKSLLVAAIGNFMFVADGENGAEVYCGATNERQALEVFKPARLQALKRPAMRERFDIEVNAKNMAVLSDGSKFEPVVGKPGDGSSPHLWIVDEYHEHPDADQVETAETGMGAREQPLLWIISTAGTDTSSPCYDELLECRKIVHGIYTGDDVERTFALMYGIDDEDDWQDVGMLAKANPNMGVSVSAEYLRDQQLNAVRHSSKQNRFLIKHLNRWVNAKTAWLPERAWRNCGDDTLKEDACRHLPYVGGLDLASKLDVCSEVRCYYEDIDDKRHYYLFATHYLPSIQIFENEQNSGRYQKWYNAGWLKSSGDVETDFTEVEHGILEHMELGQCRELTYDPYKATHVAQRINNEEGVTVTEYRQTAPMMSPAMDEIESAVVAGRLHHNNDPVLAWMFSNVVIKWYKTDYRLPTKEKPQFKIDGAVAAIMAVGRAMYEGEESGGLEEHGIREL